MSAPDQDFSTVPAQSADAAWERLEAQFELSGGFWLGFVFSAAPQAVEALRKKRNALLDARGLRCRDRHPANPDALSQMLIWLLTAAETAEVDCVWIEAIRADSPGAPAQPWTRGWEQLFLRTNEHRDALRARLRGGLVFAAPPSIMPLVREAAPDLWSVRSIVVNVEMAPSLRVPEPMPSLYPPGLHPTGELDRAALNRLLREASAPSPPPPTPPVMTKYAFTQAERQFIEALIAKGNLVAAKAHARHALAVLGPAEVIEKAFALHLLARANEASGEVVEALRSIEQAIDIHARATPDLVPVDWYDLARQLAWKDHDTAGASRHALTAIAQCRRRTRAKESVDALRDLAFALRIHGEHERSAGDPISAIDSFDEAVLVCRRLVDLTGEDPSDRVRLAESLLSLGDARTQRNDFAGAIATFEESVKVNRQICALVGDAVLPLRSLSVALNRLGYLRQETGDLEGAGQAFDEALGIRSRLFNEKDPQSIREMASALGRIGLLRLATGDFDAAVILLGQSASLDRLLTRLMPESLDMAYHLAFVLHHLGIARRKLGHQTEAKEAWEEAREGARELLHRLPTLTNTRSLLENTEKALASLMANTDEPS